MRRSVQISTRESNKKSHPGRKKAKSNQRSRAQHPALSAETYRALFSTMREAFALHEVVLGKNGKPSDFRFVEANPAFEKLTGLVRNDIVGKKVSEVLPEDQALTIIAAGKAALKESIRFEHHASAVGKYFDAHAFSPKKGTFAAIFIDVTHEKETKEELRKANEVLRALVQASPLAVIAMDPEGNIQTWSQAAERMFGWKEEEVVGRPNPIVSDLARDEDADLRQRSLQGEAFTNIEVSRQKRDGSPIDLSLSSAPLFNRHGDINGILVLYTEITDRKRLEAQFRQSQKMEAVGRLAGGVAHDFNNLLTIILGECDLSLESLEPEDPMITAFEEIKKAGERAALLTAQLLMFSRKQLFQPTNFNMNVILNDMSTMFRRLIGEDVELKIRSAEDLGLVTADRGQIEQVVVNLVVNARDAMPEGGTIVIESANVELDADYATMHSEVSPGKYVMLAVSDTGTGMSDDVKAHLFEAFFTTKELGKGTGLGLATCDGIVKQFGGHIGVYSEIGTGTTMKVYLPLSAVEGEIIESQGGQAIAEGNETILVVEDESRVRAIAARMLSALGYTVLTAADGEEALQLLSEYPETVHLLLTDVVLPRMGGRKVAELVRAMRPKIKVLFTSGYTDDVILQHRLIQHDIALVNKPYTAESLARKVRETLDQEPSGIARIIKVLIVDDDPIFCRLLKKRLEALGMYEVDFCTASVEALDRSKMFHADVVLLDVMMPGLSGPQVAEQFTEDPATMNTPFIYVTATVGEEGIRKSSDLIEGRYFLAKPVDLIALTLAIEAVLKRN
jgi:PAS domain S-box-containing protein